MLDVSVSRPGEMVACPGCGGSWASWAYTCCPWCEKSAAAAAATARYRSELETIVARHVARHAPAPVQLLGASWYALERHLDRQAAARATAYRALSDEVWNWAADAQRVAGRMGPDAERTEREAIGACSLASEPGYSLARTVQDAAAAAVDFTAEEEPSGGAGRRLKFAKGTCSVTVPKKAIARRGGGECSYLAFYGRDGRIVASYVSRSRGPETWAEPCSHESARRHFSEYRYPIEPCARTNAERTTSAVFGGA